MSSNAFHCRSDESAPILTEMTDGESEARRSTSEIDLTRSRRDYVTNGGQLRPISFPRGGKTRRQSCRTIKASLVNAAIIVLN